MNVIHFLKPKSEVAYIFDDFTIRQTLEKMHVHRYSAIPILNQKGEYIGTITEGDLLWFIKDNSFLDLKKAEDLPVMSIPRKVDNRPVYITAHIEELYRLSLDQNFIPILDDRSMFIGIVTRKDLLTFFQEKPMTKDETPYDSIVNRRSIRQWSAYPVEDELINKIVIAGLAAPSAHNRQPLHIIRVSNKDLLNELLDNVEYDKKIKEAPEAFAIFGDKSIEKDSFLLNNDASAAMENMLLAIHALGLGGVWVGAAYPQWREFVAGKLDVPNNLILFGMIAYGYPKEKKAPHLLLDQSKLHVNKWGNK